MGGLWYEPATLAPMHLSSVSTAVASLVLGTALCLTGCVTHEEQGHPEGWREIRPEKVDSLAALVPQSLAAKGYLTMGTNPPFAPFQFKDAQGAIIGVEVDLARALASVLGLELRPVEQDFAMILPAVQAGTVDFGGSGFTDTEERQKTFDFVDSLYAGIQWAQETDRSSVINPEDACGLTVAVQRNTVSHTDDVLPKSEDCKAAGKPPITLLAYDSADAAATALVLGRADAYSADSPVVSWAVERAEGKIELIGSMFMAAPYGFTTQKDSPLRDALAAALDHLITTGDYERILQQWNIREGLLSEVYVNQQPAAETIENFDTLTRDS